MLCESGRLHGRTWIVKNRHEALAIQTSRRRQAAHFGQSGKQIKQFDQRIRLRTSRWQFRRGDDQRNASVKFEVRRLAPQAMLAKMETVIGPENDYRLIRQLQPIQLVQDFADLHIEVTDTGKITVPKFDDLFFAQRTVASAPSSVGM